MNKPVISDRNHMLNVLKAIGCIGVIFIHVCFPALFGDIMKKAAQFAVPVFFMISGYYSYIKNVPSIPKLCQRIRKLIIITVIAIASYVVYSIVLAAFSHNVAGFLNQFLNVDIWIRMIAFNDFDVIHGSPLWFLPSLIYSYIILLIIERTNGWRIAYKLIPVLFVLRIIVSIVVWTIGLSWHLRCNVLIGALPWVFLGHYFASNKEKIKQISNTLMIVLAVIGGAFAVWIVIIRASVDVSEIGIVLYAASLFIYAINNPDKRVNKKMEYLGDRLSLYVYIYHVMIAGIIGVIVRLLSLDANIYMWVRPLIVALASIAVAMLIDRFVSVFKAKG